MKKQFFRVKQLADQTFLKADKSEVLNYEELTTADQRVEVLRSSIVSINKKLCPNGPINDKEKRLKRILNKMCALAPEFLDFFFKNNEYFSKKCLEYQLGTTFVEEAKEEKECVLLQHILKLSGVTEQDLAKELAEHETKVEEMVYSPLQKVIENELPSILKQKHNLKKYCLDKDSATTRYHSTKKETLKEDMEEADTKVEQSRDALAIEMFNLLARENEISSYVLQLLKLQRGYHESALKSLENIIPELEKTIGDSRVKKVFGVPLEEHLRVTERQVAYPLAICVTILSEFGLSEEGLFRIAGGLSKVKRLKASIDSGCFQCLIPEYKDVHVLASTLKLYLRELPAPLLTDHLYAEWVNSMRCPENERMDVVKKLLNKLPHENRTNLAFLIQFLARLAYHTENKMSSSNIAIVMAPNLLWNKNEEFSVNMDHCATINMLVELMIKEASTFFPDEVFGDVDLTSLVPEEELLLAKNGNNGKLTIEHVDATSTESLLDSPRPNLRKKKPAAPVPPNANYTRTMYDPPEHVYDSMSNSYPSGSLTLNRHPKGRDQSVKVKTTVGVNTEENDLSLSRKRSFSKDDIKLVNATATQQPSSVTQAPPVSTAPSNSITHHHQHHHNQHHHHAQPPTAIITSSSAAMHQTQTNVAAVPSQSPPPPSVTSLVSDASATKVVTTGMAANVSKAQPVIRPVVQTAAAAQDDERHFRTTVTHHVGSSHGEGANSSHKPVAAPRQSLFADDRVSPSGVVVSRQSSLRRPNNEVFDGDVQLRKAEGVALEMRAKPEIPARPASLAPTKRCSSSDLDPTVQRTQCSVYSVAHRQQPSIVNIHNRTEKIQLGHDVMMAEKEKFLGHSPIPRQNQLENKFNDINSNKDHQQQQQRSRPSSTEAAKPPISPKSSVPITAKSHEKLDKLDRPNILLTQMSRSSEKLNELNDNRIATHQKSSHTRTRSDGNIMELGGGQRSELFLLQTPPSPRALNKPTEPPPPPPVARKPEPESTDF